MINTLCNPCSIIVLIIHLGPRLKPKAWTKDKQYSCFQRHPLTNHQQIKLFNQFKL